MAGARGASPSSALTPVVGPDRRPSGVLVFGLIVVLLVAFVAIARVGQSGGGRPPTQAAFAGPAATSLTGSPGASSSIVPPSTTAPTPGSEPVPGTPPPRVSEAIRPVAVCPPGSKPDAPGPMAQERPPPLGWAAPMAFDRRAGRIVLVVGPEQPETWTFDVCTNTSLKMHPDRTPAAGGDQVVYDEDSDLTIMFNPATHWIWAYDLEADTWSAMGAGETPPYAGYRFRSAYDPVSGLIVALVLTGSGDARPPWLLSYDVEADTWGKVRQTNLLQTRADPAAILFAYDASVDRFILYDAIRDGTQLFDRHTGTWTPSGAVTPMLNFSWGIAAGGEIAYDEAIQRTIVTGDGMVIAYDAAAAHWDLLDDGSALNHVGGYLATGPTARMGHSIVYDAVNERIVVYGGGYRTTDPETGQTWVQADDVVAFDPVTRQWSTLLEASRIDAPPG